MNIYIYGDNTFKSEVNDIINHSNLRLYLDEDSNIEEIDSVEAIKLLIEEEPDNIYLIDNDKILKPKSLLNNKLGEKLSFLKTKGAIEEDFLNEHGVLDSKFESIEDLIKDLKNKFQERNPHKKENNSLESSFDEDMYSFDDDIDDYEDTQDLAIEGLAKDESEKILDEIDETMNTSEEILNETIENEDTIDKNNNEQECFMDDNIDNISEEEMLNALNNMDDIDISNIQTSSNPSAENESSATTKEINLSNSNANANEIASMISELLSNKTLEITIKVKS